jgi:hypothetical protein
MDPATIATLVSGAITLINGINRARAAARVAGTLTAEQDRQHDEALEKAFRSDHWRPRTATTKTAGD